MNIIGVSLRIINHIKILKFAQSRLDLSTRRIHRWHSEPLCLSNASEWDWHHLAATQQGVGQKVGFWQLWSQANPPEDLSNWSEQSTVIYSHLMMHVDRLLGIFTCFQSKNHSKYAVTLCFRQPPQHLPAIFFHSSFQGQENRSIFTAMPATLCDSLWSIAHGKEPAMVERSLQIRPGSPGGMAPDQPPLHFAFSNLAASSQSWPSCREIDLIIQLKGKVSHVKMSNHKGSSFFWG